MFSGICVLYIIGRDFYHDLLPLFAHRIGLWKDERMSISAFVDYVERKYGWKIRGGPRTYECRDIVDALADAAANGKVEFYGRMNPDRDYNLRNKPLIKIDVTHWIKHEIELSYTVMFGDNLRTLSQLRIDNDSQMFVDLHVNRQQAKRWIAREGGAWRGEYAKQKQAEDKRTSEFDAMFNPPREHPEPL